MGHVGRLGVDLGEARGADGHLVVAGDEAGQLGRVVQAAGVRAPLGLARGRVAAQGEHVVDPGGADLVEGPAQLLGGRADAAQVGHGLDAELFLMSRTMLHRAVAGGAAGAVGDGHEVGLERRAASAARAAGSLAVGRLGREELEREDRLAVAAAAAQDVVDPHGGNSTSRYDPRRRQGINGLGLQGGGFGAADFARRLQRSIAAAAAWRLGGIVRPLYVPVRAESRFMTRPASAPAPLPTAAPAPRAGGA